MRKTSICLLALVCFITSKADCQKVIEVGIKPTELLFIHFETNIGFGNAKTRYGILLSFKPSRQDSGLVKSGGSGLAGGYGHRYLNKLYTSYTFGLYNKIYINKKLDNFLQTEIFYRNWSFKKKPAEFRNVEGYRFKGLRTENVDVYCLKLLLGQTIKLTKKDKKLKPYLDIYFGIGIRYQEETYETFNGHVYDTFFFL